MPTHLLMIGPAKGIPFYGPSGSSAHLRSMAQAFSQHFDQVTVATPRSHDHRGAVEGQLDVNLCTFEPRNWKKLSYFREWGEIFDSRALVKETVARHGVPTAIYERHALFTDAGARLARQLGIPRVVELNAPLVQERELFDKPRNRRLARQTERKNLRSADRVLAVSEWLVRWAVDEVGCDAAKVIHVPNGVERRPLGDREAMRAKLGLEGIVLGFVGSMKPWHGIERIPDLLALMPEATALLVGDGPSAPAKHPRIIHVGQVPSDELGEYVSAMDVGLAPYLSSAPPWFCPLKILEYLAQGVGVVAADIGGSRNLVGDNGLILQSDEPNEWVTACRSVAEQEFTPVVRDWKEVAAVALPVLTRN